MGLAFLTCSQERPAHASNNDAWNDTSDILPSQVRGREALPLEAQVTDIDIPAPEKTGVFGDYDVLVYPDKFLRDYVGSYGIRKIVQSPDGSVLIGLNSALGTASVDENGQLKTMQITDISSLGPLVVDAIAPTQQNGTYFGGLSGYVWQKPDSNDIVQIPDSRVNSQNALVFNH